MKLKNRPGPRAPEPLKKKIYKEEVHDCLLLNVIIEIWY
jgi:hypothetical protein